MSLVRNEQTKLTATWLNGVSVAAVAVGLIAPVTAALVGTTSFQTAAASGTIWILIATGVHLGARLMLKRLVE